MSLTNRSSQSFSLVGMASYLIAALFLLYEMAVQGSPSVMVDQLMRDMGINSATLSLMASTYFWSYTFMQIPVGLMYDRFSSKILLVCAIAITALGMLFFSTTTSVLTMGLGRFLMGVGSAFAFVGVLMIAVRWFPAGYFALLVGIAQCLAAIGGGVGPWVLSTFVNHNGWRDSSLYLAAIGLCIGIVALLILRRHKSETKENTRLDRAGIWHSIKHVMGNKRLWSIVVYAFFSWGPILIFSELWGIPYLMHRFSITNTEASHISLFTWGFLAISSPVIGFLSRQFSAVCLMRWMALIGMLGGLAMLYWPDLSIWGAEIAAACIGIGASGQILTFELARQARLDEDMGFSISFINMGVVAGGIVLQPIAGALLHVRSMAHTVSGHTETLLTRDFEYALLLVPICFLFCFLISAFAIKEPQP